MSSNDSRLQSMVDLLAALVAHPSRAGVDSPASVLHTISDWLSSHGIEHVWLRDDTGEPLGLWGELTGGRPGPFYLLDATADTAPYGDPAAWQHPPDRPSIEGGWMYGRGCADSKAGIAVFCHVLADLLPRRTQLRGRLGFVFDAEEHTGSFAGIRRYMAERGREPLTGVMIGYPGNDRLITGARGFLRSTISVHGVAAHSGSSVNRGVNAIVRASQLIAQLASVALPGADDAYPLPPKITPTAIRGGGSYSLVPDTCDVDIDIRLTPAFTEPAAKACIEAELARLDASRLAPPTTVVWQPGWPAYRLDANLPMVQALQSAAAEAFGRPLPTAVAGPSNIANFLATLNVPATAGLGVTYRNIHAPDECVQLDTLAPTFLAYRNALMRLMAEPGA
jgi:succinyl-diaminopimelate desuccinylase